MRINKGKKSYSGLILGFIILLLFVLWMIWGNTTIEVSHFTIEDDNIPEGFDGFKIAQVSDLHNVDWGQDLMGPLQEENPDIIVITGDLIDAIKTDIHAAVEFVSQAKGIAPIYFVTGNHEVVSEQYDLLERELLEQGVTLLDNKATFIKNGDEILLFGIQDPLYTIDYYTPTQHKSVIDKDIQELANSFDGYKILLAHRPELFDLYVRNEINLVFTGHAHGGQFRFPFIKGVYAPDQGFFPEYTSGIYEEQHTKMIVSRGLGNSLIPVRFNNRHEVVFIHLKH